MKQFSSPFRFINAISLVLTLFYCFRASAQNAQDCAALMKFGIYDRYSVFTAESQFKQIQQFFKSYEFNSLSAAQMQAASMGIVIEGIPLSLNGKSASSNFQEWRREFVESSFMQVANAGLNAQTLTKISSSITALIKECLSTKGLHAYIVPSADGQNFTLVVDFIASNSNNPKTAGVIRIEPSSVAATCNPRDVLGKRVSIGPEGVSVAGRRLPNETVTITVNSDDGTRVLYYEAVVTPKPVVSFKASEPEIDAGQSTTLIWDVQNSSKVELVGIAAVNENGTRPVTPGETKDYELKVVSLDGKVTSSIARVTVRPPPPVLTGARINYRTTDNDKDHDTTVVTIVDVGGTTIASAAGAYGKWDDHFNAGWIGLNVVERRRKAEVLGAGTLKIVERPNGSDEWHFDYTLELTFSDGAVKTFDGSGNVDHDRPNAGRGL